MSPHFAGGASSDRYIDLFHGAIVKLVGLLRDIVRVIRVVIKKC
jgi:hypothetical protein